MKGFSGLLLAALLTIPALATAQPTPELDRAEAALVEAWSKAPLTVRRALFVRQPASGFGIYEERSNQFKPGEKLITYAEPIGFGWKEIGQELYEFGFTVDFVIKSDDGKILAGQEKFAQLGMQSHRRNREFLLTLTLDVSGLPAGPYRLEYRLHDITGAKTASFEQPFTMAP